MQTFVVRLWRPGEGAERPVGQLHGVVEGPAISGALAFRRDEELLAALRSGLRAVTTHDLPSPRRGAVT